MIQDQNFGIEIEMTGLTRKKAAEVIAEYFGTRAEYAGGVYGKYTVKDRKDNSWQLMRDGSISAVKKESNQLVSASEEYSVELVSPICKYEDIKTIQEIVRKLRQAGALANDSTGIHVHVDAARFDAASLRNLTNIMRSKEDILFKALQVKGVRESSYCRKVDEDFLQALNRKRPKTREKLQEIWYRGIDGSSEHYHFSRYHALNLHSVFQKGTVEFRLFNGTLHAGKVKTYIQLSLAICNQALTQKKASYERTVSSNEKYTFRTWLLRLGMIGKEFETARMLLLEHLDGNIAWKDPAQVEKQKQRMAERKQMESAQNECTAQEVSTQVETNMRMGGIDL